jgi:Zn-dependent M28 family amino/carboxypeptidase
LDPREILARLSGEKPINLADSLKHRNSEAERELTRVYLLGLFDRLGMTGMRHAYASGTNIYAELSSTTGGAEYVVVGGHYDSVAAGPGADDNGTGVVATIALAQHLVGVATRSRNFLFVLFDEEERGLRGSAAFVEWVKTQKYSVHSVHCIDELGWDGDGDRAIELDTSSQAIQDLYKKVMADGNLNMPLEITHVGSTDHVSFVNAGFVGATISEEYANKDTTPYYHTAGDTYSTINFDYYFSSMQVMNRVVDELCK